MHRRFSQDFFLLAEGLHLASESAELFLLLCREPFSLAAVDRVLVDPAPKGAIGDTDLAGDLGDRVLLIGSSNQPDSFSAKLRRVGLVRSWHCSPFRALFPVSNSPRNRRKSNLALTRFRRLFLSKPQPLTVSSLNERHTPQSPGQNTSKLGFKALEGGPQSGTKKFFNTLVSLYDTHSYTSVWNVLAACVAPYSLTLYSYAVVVLGVLLAVFRYV